MPMTVLELQAALDKLDDGVLKHGSHKEGREFCALEFESKLRGRVWSDTPITLPDIRPLNDAGWSSDTARTTALLPVMAALWDWSVWPDKRKMKWAELLVIEIVKQLVSELSELTAEAKACCLKVTNLETAATALAAICFITPYAADAVCHTVRYAADAATIAVNYAADAAIIAVNYAVATAASEAAAACSAAHYCTAAGRAGSVSRAVSIAEKTLKTACNIWINAANETAYMK
jgi:hypothetical protein